MKKDKNKYYGPYTSAAAVKDTIELLTKIYHVRTCNRSLPKEIGNGRPCLNHHIHQCDAPCMGYISKEDYGKQVDKAKAFLDGKYDEVEKMLKEKMFACSENMEFEEFRIVKKTENGLLLQIKEPLKAECKPEEGIARIVRGMTDVNGRYLLRVRKDGKGTDYLVRYTVNGKIGYERIIFGEQKERSLGQDGCCGSFGSIM